MFLSRQRAKLRRLEVVDVVLRYGLAGEENRDFAGVLRAVGGIGLGLEGARVRLGMRENGEGKGKAGVNVGRLG